MSTKSSFLHSFTDDLLRHCALINQSEEGGVQPGERGCFSGASWDRSAGADYSHSHKGAENERT